MHDAILVSILGKAYRALGLVRRTFCSTSAKVKLHTLLTLDLKHYIAPLYGDLT